MMDPCDSLHAYVDGELDEAKTAEFEVHLATCERCLAELPRLLALLDSLDGAADLARVKPPQLTVVDGGRGPSVAAAPSAAAATASTADASTSAAASAVPAAASIPAAPRAASVASRDELAARRARPARRGVWIAGLGAAAAAAALLVIVPRLGKPPSPPAIASLDGALGANRPFAVRLTYPGVDGYRPQNAERSAGGPTVASDRLLQLQLQLEQAKNWHGLAVAALLAGDRERARQAFARAPATPEVDADRAALELLDGKPAALERGLDAVDRAIAAAPNNATAHWNRALVLGAMNLPLAAAKEFDGIAASHEAGWADEAHTRAEAMRTQVTQRKTHWKAAREAGQRLIEDGTPIPDALHDVTGTVTLKFHDAVRSAPSPERVLALLPLARALDGMSRSTRLVDYVQRIATADFRVRKPLAERYRELALGRATPETARALLADLASGPDDIKMGAMVVADQVGARLDEYRRLATATGDPWFVLIAEQAAAAVESARGDRAAAERRLRDALALASRERLSYRANRLENDLIKLHKSELQLSLAADEAMAAYRDAIAAGEWVFEMHALSDLASIDHNRSAYSLARAYLSELALRGDAGLASGTHDAWNCQDRLYAYESLANISLLQLDPDRARVELGYAPTCQLSSVTPEVAALILRNALVRTELYRFGHLPDDARLARDRLAELRALPATVAPGKDALAAYLEGDLAIKDDPAAGKRALREAIELAGQDSEEFKLKARTYSFTLLALEAGRTSAFGDVLSVVAESLHVQAPERCAVAISADGERSAVAFRDASGAVDGEYVGTRKRGPLDTTTLVPPRAIERLRSCERVSVLARPPVLGAGRLLPPDMAWSYVLSDPASPAHSASARRLVVANPEAPPELGLPALAPYPDEPSGGAAVVLRGADATPSRALLAMRNASVIEFHTHGIIADDLFEASQLVLSPELDRQYALTPSDVAGVRLEASPLVILGACRAATSSRAIEGGMGLAEAFLRSGARAVIASPDAIQDRGALPFFAAIRDRVLAGADPAVALRDERVRQRAASHDDPWVSGVVVFE
jgi:hypothetical protein